MKCPDIQELIASYWDDLDERSRREVDRHIGTCDDCRREFEWWRESMEMVRELRLPDIDAAAVPDSPDRKDLTQAVMNRIYQDDNWRLPLVDKVYAYSNPFRRKVTGLIAFFVSLFLFSFLFSMMSDRTDTAVVYGSMLEVASASPAVTAVKDSGSAGSGVTLASVVLDPAMVRMGPLDYSTNYLLVLSLLGLISSLFILNWFVRVRR